MTAPRPAFLFTGVTPYGVKNISLVRAQCILNIAPARIGLHSRCIFSSINRVSETVTDENTPMEQDFLSPFSLPSPPSFSTRFFYSVFITRFD